MRPDAFVAVAAAAIAVGLLVADTGWLVTAALILAAGCVGAALTWWAVWAGRVKP